MARTMDKTPYIVIARKYRPQTFDEVMGQEAISTTLKNAIETGRIGHAYLFTGPRGVGKTSMARIFAKALNCKSGPTITPCGKCQTCGEIENSRALDVLEIDGASNRGIDEIRALRENVKFSPALGKFKIYIIDEVHQITTDGFNALLKTLEEPPPHVKFIFATTASQKVPATILSRCQRFDFRRIPTQKIAEVLKEICKKEKIKIDDEALFAIAKAADGSLRDSQSILDQIAACAGEKITRQHVIGSLGALEEERLVELVDALAAKDAKKALLLLDGLIQEGKDTALFAEKFLEHVRNLLFVSVSDSLKELIDAPESYHKELLRQKSLFTQEELFYFFSVISHSLSTMRRFDAKQIPLEIALVKLVARAPMEDLSKALDTLKNFEKKNKILGDLPRAQAPLSVSKPLSPLPVEEDRELPEVEELVDGELPMEPPTASNKGLVLESVWEGLLRLLKAEKMSVASYLAQGEPGGFSNGVAKIHFEEKLSFHRDSLETADNKRLIEKHLSSLLEQAVRVEFELVKALSGKVQPQKALDPETQGAVQSAMKLFGGRIV
jgi:DNA polymerase-3 subunit gamma/tau